MSSLELLGQRPNVLRAVQVQRIHESASSCGADALCQRPEFVFAARDQQHLRSCLREKARGRFSYAKRSAGDQDRLPRHGRPQRRQVTATRWGQQQTRQTRHVSIYHGGTESHAGLA